MNNYPTILIASPFNPIGESLIRRFVRKNCNLILMDQNAAKLEQAQHEFSVFQARIKTVYTNWHEHEQITGQIEELYEELEEITVLISLMDTDHPVNNLLIPSIPEGMEMMNLNYFANIALIECILPMMSEENSGSIVLLGDCKNKSTVHASYRASKSALNSYITDLQDHFENQKVQITTLNVKIDHELEFNNSGDQIAGLIDDLLFTEKTHRIKNIDIH